jgi:cytoskeletal protein CcmA (bactofilin family)
MIEALTAILLILLTATVFALPFMPAMLELRWQTDAEPLRVVRAYDHDIRHFARGFRGYLRAQFPDLGSAQPGGESEIGTLPDGTRFLFVNSNRVPIFTYRERNEGVVNKVIIANTALDLPDGMTLLLEAYSTDWVRGGIGGVYRGVFGERDVTLGPESVVLRWLHAEGSVDVGRDSVLYGRLSAEQLAVIGDFCEFERVQAPRIEFGALAPEHATPATSGAELHAVQENWSPRARAERSGNRWLVRGNVTIPEAAVFDADLVATGMVRVETGARVRGSLKGRTGLSLADDVRVGGSVVSANWLNIGRRCSVQGPVIAEGEVRILAGSVIGSYDRPTTITAPRIVVSPGVVAHGQVWAREMGIVR